MKLERVQLRKKTLALCRFRGWHRKQVYFWSLGFYFLDQVIQNCLYYSFSCKIQSEIGIFPYTKHTSYTMHVCQVLKHEVMEKLINY